MSRPWLVTVFATLLLATAGIAVISTISRARSRAAAVAARGTTAQPGATPAQQPATAAPPATAASTAAATPARPRPVAAPAPQTFAVAQVPGGEQVALRARPGGRVLASVTSSTQFGSPQTLAVAVRRGRWLGVTSTDLPNGRIGWVDSKAAQLRTHVTRMSIRVDLSRRRLELFDGRRAVRSATVGIGRPGSPTPTGRFAVTDKLSGSAYGPYYGCCILALSGHQTNTPAGWQGGNRLAIHGTNDPASIGAPSSAGCLHAAAADLRVLMRRVPLGTPVFIRN